MRRNFYNGIGGDQVNLLLGVAMFNFEKKLNKFKKAFLGLFEESLLSVRTNFLLMGQCTENINTLFRFKINYQSLDYLTDALSFIQSS